MQATKAIELLNRQIARSKELPDDELYTPEWKKWKRDTEVVIERLFGRGCRHLNDFKEIRYASRYNTPSTTFEDRKARYEEGLETARHILSSMVEELTDFGLKSEHTPSDTDMIQAFTKFHRVARQLRVRHSDRATLAITDEYDVQDLLHALLHLFADDIRKEEWSPSYAGGCSRADFLLKKERLVIEVKKTRKNLGPREVGNELLVDIGRYQSHPDCQSLLCFVYDPEGIIGNPTGLENDLTKMHGNLSVTVIVAPK